MPDDKDKTPVEPLMARKRSSQSAMVAIGWRTCPSCNGSGDCDLCWDQDSLQFARRVPPDVFIKWIQEHRDTDPAPPEDK